MGAMRCSARFFSGEGNWDESTLRTRTPAGMFDGSMHKEGELGSANFRVFFKDIIDKTVSPWHDVRLQTAMYGKYNAVVLNPKGTKSAMSIAVTEENTPIAPCTHADADKAPSEWNIGILPQTWVDPNGEHLHTALPGDFHPISVIDIGSTGAEMGDVLVVKPLGLLPLSADGKTKWTVICINMADPIAYELTDMAKVNEMRPGVIDKICEFYKSKQFTLHKDPLDKVDAAAQISICFDMWRNLRLGTLKNDVGVWTKKVSSWTDGL